MRRILKLGDFTIASILVALTLAIAWLAMDEGLRLGDLRKAEVHHGN